MTDNPNARGEMKSYAPSQMTPLPSDAPVRAFPSTAIDPAFAGMDLRDYFAAHAPPLPAFNGTVTAWNYADWAYQYADVMMKKREMDR